MNADGSASGLGYVGLGSDVSISQDIQVPSSVQQNGFTINYLVAKRTGYSDMSVSIKLDGGSTMCSNGPISTTSFSEAPVCMISATDSQTLGGTMTLTFQAGTGSGMLLLDNIRLVVINASPSQPPPSSPPPPPTTFYIRGSRSQIVFGTNDECTLELASGATSLTSSCPINTPSSRRLEDASNDSDRITQLETRIAQLEMDNAEMKEQVQFLTTELKMLKEQR